MTILDYLLALIAYPVLEEIIFRLHLMALLATRFPAWRPLAVNAVASAAFSLAHLPFWPWWHAVAVFLPSMLLGLVMQRTGRWTVCAALHGIMNACYLAGTYVGLTRGWP
ncbi:MAG: JDVT-CTERM system glutamic-type intramembrane protease [Pseudomonadota bacterium]